jgi:hypothetical protein
MAEQGKSTVTLMSGGDIGPVYEPTEEFAELIAPVLKQADLRLGQCERVYSERGWEPQFALGPGGQHTCLHPRMAGVWDAAGIDIVSIAFAYLSICCGRAAGRLRASLASLTFCWSIRSAACLSAVMTVVNDAKANLRLS